MTLAALIRSLRARLDLTQAELAEHLACSVRTLQLYESGAQSPGSAMLAELARVAGVAIQVDARGWRVLELAA